mmetsp:Transcript_10746/g.34157  ORF Transcript_10746/g.34157 Transcript_10746/m.34157 type:complete len:268 (+) Transcript_10746:317-1120(+)
MCIVAEQEGNEDARNHNVAKSEHRMSGISVLRGKRAHKQQLDRRVEVFRHCHHHVCAKHPEHIVQEEAAKQDGADLVGTKRDVLDPLNGKRNPEQIICGPVLGLDVHAGKEASSSEGDHVGHAKLDVHLALVVEHFGNVRDGERDHALLLGEELSDVRVERGFQNEGAQQHKVAAEDQVDVVLVQKAEQHVQPEQEARSDNGEHPRILCRHGLRILLALQRRMAPDVDRAERSNQQIEIDRYNHKMRGHRDGEEQHVGGGYKRGHDV